MKLPAIKAEIGNLVFYVTVLTFEQVSLYVEKIDDNLYDSNALKDLLQRSITKNYSSIRDYILHQPDLFFNSLVLAVYNDFPDWHQIVVKFDGAKFNQFGVLEFPGKHKIFPVDGQHRVEGIKEAIKDNPKFKSQQIGAIFIGHKNDIRGKKLTRRIFTTLNRYAKPVSLRDSVALDEDDSVAILTRVLLEEFTLFKGERVIDVKGKAIPKTNVRAFTSIITFYQCNLEIFKVHYERTWHREVSNKGIEKYLKFRPSEDEIEAFKVFSFEFWSSFSQEMSVIKNYLIARETPAAAYRNSDTGGNLLFRPVGLLPFIKAVCQVYLLTKIPFSKIFKKFNKMEFAINKAPWVSVVWNDLERKMIMSAGNLTFLLLLHKYDSSLLTKKQLMRLEEGYASALQIDVKSAKRALKNI